MTSSDQLKIVIVGHVDHGKSTFVGRLFHDTGSLPEGKYEQLVAIAQRRGVPFEFANLMDALQSERDQNITIDTSQIWFKTAKRQYVIIDAPGHKEFLKNMVTGAAQADAALLLIAANEGVQEQSRRHGYLLSLLGIKQVAVVVNKMDLVGYSQEVYDKIEAEYRAFLRQLGVEPLCFIPISAKLGENVASLSKEMPWYAGQTVLATLDEFKTPQPPVGLPFRFVIQDIYRFDHRRILAGRIASGSVKVGDTVQFLPRGKTSTVKSIEYWSGPALTEAHAGQSVGLTLTEQIFVERGHVAAHPTALPHETTQFKANLFWLGKSPLLPGKKYKLKLVTQEIECQVKSIEKVIDASSLSETQTETKLVARNDVAELILETKHPVAFDLYSDIAETGRFVIVDNKEVSGGGIILHALKPKAADTKSDNITWSSNQIQMDQRFSRNRHKGAVLWFTGLSGSGKSTLATGLERELFLKGRQVFILDGDNVRYGLNRDLGFSPEDREENIRRVGEVAKLMAEAGLIVITAFISPYRHDRARVREILAEDSLDFHEVYVNAPLEVCEQRDPKKLYAKARRGEIKEFTGISAPYEAPENPDLEIHTSEQTYEESLAQVLEFALEKTDLPGGSFEI
jgi:bifunctional enzyme CysN/CysC